MKKIGLKIKDSSNVFVVTANGTKTRALGKIPDLQIALQTLAVPITLQVIESSEDTLLLGTDWFHKTNANLNFGTNTIKLQYEDKVVTIPITHHVDEDPKCIAFEDDDNISQEKYEEEYEDESYDEEEINYSDHAIETDEEYYSEDIALDYNPWTNEIKFEERPAASLAHAEVYNSNEWNVKDDLHVGPLNYHQQSLFQTLISESADICAASQTDIGRTNIIQHEIHLKDDQPIASHPYRSNPTNKEFLKTEISNMEERGLIKKSKSPWASPVVIVDKKTGDKRICIDYRKLNANTKTDAFPLPRIDDLLDSYRNANWFTTLDLASGYWQVEMKEDDREKTAFITPFGLYEFTVMPFGLCNAPATFQRLMNYVLQDHLGKFVSVYLDDIIIYSKNFEQHLDHIKLVFESLRQANLKIKLKKCFFCLPNIPFLGHIVGRNGIKPDPSKIEKIKNFPVPTNLTQLRAALGLFSYYRKFIKDFSKIAKPMTQLLKKEEEFLWTDTQQRAFEYLKERLISSPILGYPDFEKPFFLYTDASGIGLGAVLSQLDENGKEYVVAYASRSLNKTEQNYGITDMECLAIVWAIQYFYSY